MVTNADFKARLTVAPDGLAAIVATTGERLDFRDAVSLVPWRANELAPHEPRMPPHQYCIIARGLTDEQFAACQLVEFLIDKHPEAYRAYFRGYQRPMRYLECDEMRYWRSWHGRPAINRCRLDSTEPPRRLDEGAKPIPSEEWGSRYPWWPQGSGYGDWKKENGRWVFYPEEAL